MSPYVLNCLNSQRNSWSELDELATTERLLKKKRESEKANGHLWAQL